jgi:hypothetical protein
MQHTPMTKGTYMTQALTVGLAIAIAGISLTACGSGPAATHAVNSASAAVASGPAAVTSAPAAVTSAPAAVEASTPAGVTSAPAAVEASASPVDRYVQGVFATWKAKGLPGKNPTSIETWLTGFSGAIAEPGGGSLDSLSSAAIGLKAIVIDEQTGVYTKAEAIEALTKAGATWTAALLNVGHEYDVPAATINWYLNN